MSRTMASEKGLSSLATSRCSGRRAGNFVQRLLTTLGLTERTPCPMLGISGLLNLLTWVEHRQQAQASLQKEGGALCPLPHSPQSPPVCLQASHWPVDGSAPGQSPAASLVAKLLARTSVGSKSATKQGGR